MSRKDAVALASRTLALLLVVWALSDLSSLPEVVHSFLRYTNEPLNSGSYQQHYYLIRLSFLVVRIVGYSLLARWLYQGGPDVEALLLHSTRQENVTGD